MPLDYAGYVQRLDACDQRLDALFNPQPKSPPKSGAQSGQKLQVETEKPLQMSATIINHIREVKEYFRLSYKKTSPTQEATIENIIKTYEKLIEQLVSVNTEGKMNPEVSGSINARLDSRRLAILAFDLKKAGELVFWASAGASLFAAIFLVALPMVIVQPSLGLAISIAIGGLLYNAAANAIQCLSEFRSTARHSTMYDNEYRLFEACERRPDTDDQAQQGACSP